MYIMIAVIGSCLTGASATSQAFLSFRVSISSVVGGARTGVLEDTCFWRTVSASYIDEMRNMGRRALLPVEDDVYPGGSEIPDDLGFVEGGVFTSMTHCGGGGGGAAAIFGVSGT